MEPTGGVCTCMYERDTTVCVSSGHVGGHPRDQLSSGSFARGSGPSVGSDDSDANEFTGDAGSWYRNGEESKRV